MTVPSALVTSPAATDPLSTVTSAVSAGKQYRLGRLFGSDGRTLVLPVDHGSMLGRLPGLEDPVAVMERFLPLGCDGFLIGPGVAARTARHFARRGAPARLLTIDTYWRGPETERHVLMTSLERAAALGVDGVKVLMPWDVAPAERGVRSQLVADVITAAEPLGLPVMVEPIVLAAPRPPGSSDIEADGGRMAAELGADIIKVYPPEDPDVLAMWCAELAVPVVILGGPAAGSPDELLATVKQAMDAGARGITIGRRVWQRPLDEAAEVLRGLLEVVHPGRVAEEGGGRPETR